MKRGSNDQTLYEVLKEWLANHPRRNRYEQSLIEKVWQEQMGATISHQTESVVFRNSILYLKIRSSALKQELHMGREKILRIISESLPEVNIKEVRIL